MIMVAVVAGLLGEYTAALARATERLLPPRRRISGFRFRASSSSSSTTHHHRHQQDSSSFILYF